jgi:hypothetical protein
MIKSLLPGLSAATHTKKWKKIRWTQMKEKESLASRLNAKLLETRIAAKRKKKNLQKKGRVQF